MENKSEFYYEKLKDTITPGTVIAQYYCSLYGFEITKSEIIMFNKLVGSFGRFTVFFSVSQMYGSYPKLKDNPYPLLYTICHRRFEEAHEGEYLPSRSSLTKHISELKKELEEHKKFKLKPPSSKGLE